MFQNTYLKFVTILCYTQQNPFMLNIPQKTPLTERTTYSFRNSFRFHPFEFRYGNKGYTKHGNSKQQYHPSFSSIMMYKKRMLEEYNVANPRKPKFLKNVHFKLKQMIASAAGLDASSSR